MIKIAVLAAASILFLGCKSTDEEKAKSFIQKYIKENANDPDSYEPIEFGELDTFMMSVIFSKDYEDVFQDYDAAPDGSRHKDDAYHELIRLKLEPSLNPKCFVIRHKFRSKNGFGAKVLAENDFFINSSMDSVLYIDDRLVLRK